MKIYTKKGDNGETSAYGGRRVLKCDFNIEAVGEVDELNAVLGVLVNRMEGEKELGSVTEFVEKIQEDLFIVGSLLSGKKDFKESVLKDLDLRVSQMEENIDKMWGEMPELKHFLIPGGSEVGGYLYYVRALARRAERAVVESKLNNETVLKYLNRLSDYLFCAGRWVNFRSKVEEKVWKAA